MRGIPVRVEIGPKRYREQIEAVLVRRDTHEKITVSLDEIAGKGERALGDRSSTICWSAQEHTAIPTPTYATTLG